MFVTPRFPPSRSKSKAPRFPLLGKAICEPREIYRAYIEIVRQVIYLRSR
ncbi:hypothetical protein RchiOBHm_Chr1g0365161 [Rosa chinensis]|uniref:Uncharacterized protein n=1 Tax=Rosa chinensis TaxID=74649 RepID=A0A2P6SJX1_ROSCH|nr:hypothetical protein RchiOBHm_Chr1g0365161 [Rosa chinensis]